MNKVKVVILLLFIYPNIAFTDGIHTDFDFRDFSFIHLPSKKELKLYSGIDPWIALLGETEEVLIKESISNPRDSVLELSWDDLTVHVRNGTRKIIYIEINGESFCTIRYVSINDTTDDLLSSYSYLPKIIVGKYYEYSFRPENRSNHVLGFKVKNSVIKQIYALPDE